jgi:hypothetical protein
MTTLPANYWMRLTEVLCPRCVKAGRDKLEPAYLHELTLNDGEQSVHALFCFAKHCRFNEIRAQTGPRHEQVMTLRLQLKRAEMRLWRDRLLCGCVIGALVAAVVIVAALR